MPVCHCEQSWEGGRSRLASPETGHGAKVTGDAAGGASAQDGRDRRPILLFLPVVFPEFLTFQRGRSELTREIHHETKVPYSEFKTRMPIVPPILTSQYIEQELRRTYYPSLKRHPADTAVTLEEKTRVMIEIMGEEKLNYWIDRTFEETCEEAEKEGLRKKYPNPNDYHKELARLVAINQEKLILRLHRTARSIHYRTQQPYERVTQLVDSHEMRYDSKKFSRELLMKLRAKEQREGTCGII